MVQIDQEKSEILVQKLEGIAKDKDLASFLGDSITKMSRMRLLEGRFTLDQFGRILRAYELESGISTPEAIEEQISQAKFWIEMK